MGRCPLEFRAVVSDQGSRELLPSFGEVMDILGLHRTEVRRLFEHLFSPDQIRRSIRNPVIDLSEVSKCEAFNLVCGGEKMQAVLSRVLSLSENRLESAGYSRTPQVWNGMILKYTLTRIATDNVVRREVVVADFTSRSRLQTCHSQVVVNPAIRQQDSSLTASARFQTFGSDCAPALRRSAIIFCTRTQGRCNQHGMGEGIVG